MYSGFRSMCVTSGPTQFAHIKRLPIKTEIGRIHYYSYWDQTIITSILSECPLLTGAHITGKFHRIRQITNLQHIIPVTFYTITLSTPLATPTTSSLIIVSIISYYRMLAIAYSYNIKRKLFILILICNL
jgi:hypothetical protein